MEERFREPKNSKNLKILMLDYNKGFFKFDRPLYECLRNWSKRLFNENSFHYLLKTLQNKFSKAFLQKNFGQKSLINRRKYFKEFVGILISK